MKFIKSLENEDEASLENLESIFEEIVGFSEKLYANPLGDSWRLEDLDWSLISEEGANCWTVLLPKRKFVRLYFS